MDTLYYKYYQGWYNEFFNDAEIKEYQGVLDNLFEEIKRDIRNKDVIEINGYHNLLPLNPTDFNELKAKKGIKLLAFMVIFFICIFLLGGDALLVQKKISMDISSQSAIFTISILLGVFLISTFFENRSNFMSKILEKLIDKL